VKRVNDFLLQLFGGTLPVSEEDSRLARRPRDLSLPCHFDLDGENKTDMGNNQLCAHVGALFSAVSYNAIRISRGCSALDPLIMTVHVTFALLRGHDEFGGVMKGSPSQQLDIQ
jgi:hypothetical protein